MRVRRKLCENQKQVNNADLLVILLGIDRYCSIRSCTKIPGLSTYMRSEDLCGLSYNVRSQSVGVLLEHKCIVISTGADNETEKGEMQAARAHFSTLLKIGD